jgi:hypothetical protein
MIVPIDNGQMLGYFMEKPLTDCIVQKEIVVVIRFHVVLAFLFIKKYGFWITPNLINQPRKK